MAEANDRFEQYTRELIKAFYTRFEVLSAQQFGPRKTPLTTPDVLLKDKGEIVMVLECKATKLTYDAQFSENPIEEAEKAYNQIVKGVTQVWKFFSHVRRGIYIDEQVATSTIGVILTMEAWGQASAELQTEITDQAKKQLENNHDVIETDMRPVVFCSIQDIADIMFESNEDVFLASIANAAVPKYRGWGLREVRKQTAPIENVRKDFPLAMEEHLPWWERFNQTQ